MNYLKKFNQINLMGRLACVLYEIEKSANPNLYYLVQKNHQVTVSNAIHNMRSPRILTKEELYDRIMDKYRSDK